MADKHSHNIAVDDEECQTNGSKIQPLNATPP